MKILGSLDFGGRSLAFIHIFVSSDHKACRPIEYGADRHARKCCIENESMDIGYALVAVIEEHDAENLYEE